MTVPLTLDEYRHVRDDDLLFVVLPGHEIPDAEDVLVRTDRYFVVRKHAEVAPIVVVLDPGRAPVDDSSCGRSRGRPAASCGRPRTRRGARACSSRRRAWQSSSGATTTCAATALKPDVTSQTWRSRTSTTPGCAASALPTTVGSTPAGARLEQHARRVAQQAPARRHHERRRR